MILLFNIARNWSSEISLSKLKSYFQTLVEVPRIKAGERQTIETLINEEALLLAKFLRNERKEWNPRKSNQP
jgi:hypothetical protein